MRCARDPSPYVSFLYSGTNPLIDMLDTPIKKPHWLSLCLVLMLALQGCGDAFVDPFHNEGRYYTIYGFLDLFDREHVVRVTPVTRRPETIEGPSSPQATIDAEVRSINKDTGEEVIWHHNLEQLSDGTYRPPSEMG